MHFGQIEFLLKHSKNPLIMMWRSNHPTVFGSERVIKLKECSFFCSKQLRPEATMLKRRGLGGGGVNSHSSPNRGGGGTVLHQNHLVGGLRNNGIIFTPVFTHQPHNTVRNCMFIYPFVVTGT